MEWVNLCIKVEPDHRSPIDKSVNIEARTCWIMAKKEKSFQEGDKELPFCLDRERSNGGVIAYHTFLCSPLWMMIMVCGIAKHLYCIDLWVDKCAWGETLFASCWNCLLPLFTLITHPTVAQSIIQLLQSTNHLGLIIKRKNSPNQKFLSFVQQSPAVHIHHPTSDYA